MHQTRVVLALRQRYPYLQTKASPPRVLLIQVLVLVLLELEFDVV
jgi:hypothetical protein